MGASAPSSLVLFPLYLSPSISVLYCIFLLFFVILGQLKKIVVCRLFVDLQLPHIPPRRYPVIDLYVHKK